MKILKVEFDQEEQEQIYQKLIGRFNGDTDEKQSLNFPLNETVEIWAELELESEGYLEAETNSPITTERHVHKFRIWHMINGEEVEYQLSDVTYKSKIDGLFYTKRATGIEDLISNNYSI